FTIASLASWIVLTGQIDHSQWNAASHAALRTASGVPQLVSIDALPAMARETGEGQLCEWIPASAGETLAESLPEPADQSGSVSIARAPVRIIRDTYPTYS